MTHCRQIASVALSMHFDYGVGDRPGGMPSYEAARLPMPRYYSDTTDLRLWRADPDLRRDWLFGRASAAYSRGIRGVLVGLYGGPPREAIAAGHAPACEVVWRREGRRGLLDELRGVRDAFAGLVEADIIQEIVLRPGMEGGRGLMRGQWSSPAAYSDTLDWIATDLYAGLPVTALMAHWNGREGLREAMPGGGGIPVAHGWSAYRPGWGDLDLHLAGSGRDAITRVSEATGIPGALCEVGTLDDGTRDAETGWVATGLREASVVDAFLRPIEALRRSGHLKLMQWMNSSFSFGARHQYLLDGRWDGPSVAPEALAWWRGEVTPENGWLLAAGSP